MRIQGVGNTKLTILVESNRPYFSGLGQEERMKLATRHLLDFFAFKVLVILSELVLVLVLNLGSFIIHVENLSIDHFRVLVFAKLKAGIFAYSIYTTVFTAKQTMLEAKRILSYLVVSKCPN